MAHKFKIKGISDVRLRSDGGELLLEFQTAQREKLTLVVPGWALTNLAFQLMRFNDQAEIKRHVPPDSDPPVLSFDAPPPIFYAAPGGLQCIVRPESGALDLQIQDVMDHEIQVLLTLEHVEALLDAMRQIEKLRNDMPSN